ncbi:ParB/RepB/Spo0J family partition protein [Streptomyces sp. B-S-A8]|uniref:ParB/RepB/Spo0J family partition protein n=1 Tax=Streptomyces solicavernae TaxID=3043614 RepID=A0ABT6S107_9ACTN|nr:ParB/RepB/Spo0J family partition protein [Streptomyces sp. B-S-A8]MDI3390377.1 ParB/RepB/Spo0J family partition protein [Streptomyces sp. B-S-A8]
MGRRTSLASLAGAKVDDVPGRSDLLLLALPLAKLIPTRFNPRRNFGTEEQLREFGLKLKQKQLQPAVVVSRAGYLKLWPEESERIGDVPYIIANGERRFRASQLVGRPTLDVVHHEEIANSRAEFLDAVLAENNDREDLDPIERAFGIETMVVELGGADRVARHYGKSSPWVSNQRKLLRLTPELQQLVSSGEVSIRIGRDIAGLPQEEQADAWQAELDRRAAVLAAPRPRRTKDESAGEPVGEYRVMPEAEVEAEAEAVREPAQGSVEEQPDRPRTPAPGPEPAQPPAPVSSGPATAMAPAAPATAPAAAPAPVQAGEYGVSVPARQPAAAERPEPLPDIATVGAIPWRNPETVFRTIKHWMTPEDLQSLHKLMREDLQGS